MSISQLGYQLRTGGYVDTANHVNRLTKLQPWDHEYRFTVFDQFEKLPFLEGVFDQADTSYTEAEIENPDLANQNWSIAGTSAANSGVDRATSVTVGGISLTTGGTANNQMILTPNSDSGFDGAISAATTNLSAKEPWLRGMIYTGSTTGGDNSILVFGFKLTNTLDTGTDADQAYFRCPVGANFATSPVSAVISINGTDTQVATGISLAASTAYRLDVIVDAARVAHFFINNNEVATSDPLKTNVSLIPKAGVQTTASATAVMGVNWLEFSRNRAA